MSPGILTVGHSNLVADELLRLLKEHAATAVADVRSSPYSRLHPQFNREALEKSLRSATISYVFLGRELGARTEDESCYVRGAVVYERLAQTTLFQEGIERVLKGAAKYRIALLCAEREPLTCHRAILVSRILAGRGVRVSHIQGDASLESHAALEDRLLAKFRLRDSDLFSPRAELLDEAYRRQGAEIAYKRDEQRQAPLESR